MEIVYTFCNDCRENSEGYYSRCPECSSSDVEHIDEEDS
jgi:anaerobic ribonucleoside-triphosphate reductase